MHPIALAVFASVLWGVGTVLQKKGMAAKFPRIALGDFLRQIVPIFKALFSNWLWTLGFVLMLAGGAIFATALSRGDITVVQPIVALTGAVAAAAGVTFLGEKVRASEWLGIGTILLGVVIVGAASGEPMARVPTNREAASLMIFSVALTAFAFVLRKMKISNEFTLSFAAGILFGLSNPMLKLMTQRASLETGLPFSFAEGAIWASGLTDYPAVVVLLANLGATVFFQTALANGRASVISPIVTIMSTVLPILAGVTIFGESVKALQVAGMAIVLFGTALLARKEEALKTA